MNGKAALYSGTGISDGSHIWPNKIKKRVDAERYEHFSAHLCHSARNTGNPSRPSRKVPLLNDILCMFPRLSGISVNAILFICTALCGIRAAIQSALFDPGAACSPPLTMLVPYTKGGAHGVPRPPLPGKKEPPHPGIHARGTAAPCAEASSAYSFG